MATVAINPEKINDLVKENEVVFVDFWAPWCGPCRAFGPIFEQASEKYPDAVFAKVNTDEYQSFAAQNSIMSIPTVWVFKGGQKVYDNPGTLRPDEIDSLVG